jgi:hydroxyethylthiazole kinase-like uncharacterized protein yjeF
MTGDEPVLVTSGTLRDWPLPAPGSDKEARGLVLVVGGSRHTPGAVILAGESALRAGGGKLQIATTESSCTAVAVAVPEALVLPLAENSDGRIATADADSAVAAAEIVDVVLLGPGLLDVEASIDFVGSVLPRLDTSVVIDALASAYVTEHQDCLRHLGGRCVLTVNPMELSRILGREEDEVSADPVTAARDAAALLGAVVLCGGSEKAIATPDGQVWLVQLGNPGLGISGSGDTQSGIVAGLLARGAEPAQAAVWGGYLHGRIGELLAVSVGPVGFLAREIPAQVPGLLADLTG